MEFTPEQKVLNDLFGNDLTYVIPEYQRPYSWDCIGKSDKNNQVNVIWQDLLSFFESDNPNIYFMGSMVVIGDGTKRVYEVVDGQQRLTTLTILLTAIKCFLQEISITRNIQSENQEEFIKFIKASSDNVDKLIFNEKRNGLYTEPEKKVKIERTVGFDYDNVLKTVMECGNLSSIDVGDATEEQLEVTHRYFKNRNYFVEQLKGKFLHHNLFTFEKAEELSRFFDFLKNKVTVVQVRAPQFDVAYQIFEILNNRGLPLSNKDLFRNFLISQFHKLKDAHPKKYADLDPNKKWRDLEINYDLDNEFISRYVESKLGKSQQYSAFNDIKKICFESFQDSLQKSRIDHFYDDILLNVKNYTKIINNDFNNKHLKNRISFLLSAGNVSYTLNLLMSLFRQESEETKVLQFIKTFEKYTIYTILGPSKRYSTKPIYQAINHLNNGETALAMSTFNLSEADLPEFKKLFDHPIIENDIAKLIISRYYYAIENLNPEDVVTQELDFANATLEHIIPQNPDKNTNWLKDFSDDFRKTFTYKLGNMTLLTQRMNASARNFDFSEKRIRYAHTKLALTHELSTLENITENFIQKRHLKIVSAILKDID